MELATDDQRVAAERADPLTRARFWAGEYEKEPENIETAKYFAKSLRDIESHDRVVQVASDTLILYPADYDMLMLLGRSYISLGKPDLATRAFGRAIQVDNSRAEAFASLGLAYDKLGQHQYAQRAYTRALKIDPNRTSTLTNYGLSQALAGNIDGAEAALRKAADNSDADMRVRQNLALVLGLQGKFDEMKTVDNSAPEAVMKKNAEVLQQMIEQDSTVPARAGKTELSMVSPAIAEPAPKETLVTEGTPPSQIISAPAEPVVTAELPEIRSSAGGSKKMSFPKPIATKPAPKAPQVKTNVPAVAPTSEKPKTKAVEASTEADETDKVSFLRGSLE